MGPKHVIPGWGLPGEVPKAQDLNGDRCIEGTTSGWDSQVQMIRVPCEIGVKFRNPDDRFATLQGLSGDPGFVPDVGTNYRGYQSQSYLYCYPSLI